MATTLLVYRVVGTGQSGWSLSFMVSIIASYHPCPTWWFITISNNYYFWFC